MAKYGLIMIGFMASSVASANGLSGATAGQKYQIDSRSGPECFIDLPSGFVDDFGHANNVGDIVTISFDQGGVSVTNSNPNSPTTENFDVGTVEFGGEISEVSEGKFLTRNTFQLKETDRMAGGSETITFTRSGQTITTEIVFSNSNQVFSHCVFSAMN
jgi:hypothetical protein